VRVLAPLTVRGSTFVWGTRTYVMGIVNATPDSFSGDGIARDGAAAVRLAKAFVAAGADIIDIGGESTRPGHEPVSEDEEVARVLPAIEAIRRAVRVPISIDTFKPAIATRALELGADIVNCVWGAMPGIVAVAARAHAPLIVMHNRAAADYSGDVVAEVIESLAHSVQEASAARIPSEHIIVDPGIGFGKTAEHNIEILRRLDEFVDALPYAASVALAIARGADIVRVHDVEDMMAVVQVADALSRDTANEQNEVARARARGTGSNG